MIRSILLLRTDPNRMAALVETFRELRVLELAVELAGALSCELSTSIDSDGRAMVLAMWPDEAAYQTWIDHPVRAALNLADHEVSIEIIESRGFSIATVAPAHSC